jgi:hypothetical protein
MKNLLAMVLITILILSIPVVTTLKHLMAPPTSEWSNPVVIMEYPDDSVRRYSPVDVFQDGDEFVAVRLAEQGFEVNRVDQMGQAIKTQTIKYDTSGVWQLEGMVLKNNRLSLALFGQYTLRIVELNLDEEVAIDQAMYHGVTKYDVADHAVIFSNEEGVQLVAGDYSHNFGLVSVVELGIAREGNKVSAVISKREHANVVNELYHIDTESKSINMIALKDSLNKEYGTIEDIQIENGLTGLLFTNENGWSTKQTITYSVVLSNGIEAKELLQNKEGWYRSGAKIAAVKPEYLTLVLPAQMATGVELAIWNTNEEFHPNMRATNASTLITAPKLFLGEDNILTWTEIKSEGKRINMASTNDNFGVTKLNAMDIITSMTMVFVSFVTVTTGTVIPYMLHFGIAIVILYFLEKKLNNSWFSENVMKIFIILTIPYVFYLLLGIFVPSTAKMMFLASFMRISWVRNTLLVLVIGFSIMIANSIIKQKKIEESYIKMVTYSLILGFMYTISFNIYVPIELGLKKIFFM